MPRKERTDLMIELLRENGYGLRDLKMLGEVLTSKEFEQSIATERSRLDERINEALFKIGIPSTRTVYVKQAIKLKLDSDDELTMGEIYARIGDDLGVASSTVETRIKAAIEIVWRSGDRQGMKKYLGENLVKQEHRPQNRVFIRALVEYFSMEGLK